MNSSEKRKESVRALEAYVQALDGDVEGSLKALNGRTDGESILRKLDILLNCNRFAEAAELVSGLEPETRWCHQAAFALVYASRLATLDEIVDWCNQFSSPAIRHYCRVRAAQAIYARIVDSMPSSTGKVINSIDTSHFPDLQNALELLGPVLSLVRSNQQIGNDVESIAVKLSIECCRILGTIAQASELREILSDHQQSAVVEGQDVLMRLIPPSESLPQRMRSARPDSFRVHWQAALIEGEHLHKYKEAFEAAKLLIERDKSTSENDDLFKLLYSLAQHLDDHALEEVEQAAERASDDIASLVQCMKISRMVEAGEIDQADALLKELPDEHDPIKLQLSANVALQRGETDDALRILSGLSHTTSSPGFLRQFSKLSFENGRFDLAQEALERLVKLEPDEVDPLKNLGIVYIELNLYEMAADVFDLLAQLESEDISHPQNRAICLAKANRIEEAIDYLTTVQESGTDELSTRLLLSDLLMNMGRIDDSFQCLSEIRVDGWGNPQFLIQFMLIAHAANQDTTADEALAALLEIQENGLTEGTVLEQKTVPELVGMMKEHRQRLSIMSDQLLAGSLPWLAMDKMLGKPTYGAWDSRTRQRSWIVEERREIAVSTIYSTNGLLVKSANDREHSSAPVSCPDPGSSIVIDISSLITIHRLGLLDTAARYFDRIHVPAGLLSLALDEARQLRPHQLSQLVTIQRIRECVDSGVLSVHRTSEKSSCDTPIVDEYSRSESAGDTYGFQDLLSVMTTAGTIDSDIAKSLAAVSHRQPRSSEAVTNIAINRSVLIDLVSLQTICSQGALESVADSFDVLITESEYNDLVGRIREFDSLSKVAHWHQDMWKTIRDDDRFVKSPHTERQDKNQGVSEDVVSVSMAASILALSKQLPLLVDDRTIQQIVVNGSTGRENVAFSTSHALDAFFRHDRLSLDDWAHAYTQFFRWRYRFLVVPWEVMKRYSDKYASGLPGDGLVMTARYVQECMRDPGLFVGLEQTDPPSSLAMHFVHSWNIQITRFLIEVMRETNVVDGLYSEESALGLVDWAVKELIPSTPWKHTNSLGVSMATNLKEMTLSATLLKTFDGIDARLLNTTLQSMKNSLNVSDDEYAKVIVRVIDSV